MQMRLRTSFLSSFWWRRDDPEVARRDLKIPVIEKPLPIQVCQILWGQKLVKRFVHTFSDTPTNWTGKYAYSLYPNLTSSDKAKLKGVPHIHHIELKLTRSIFQMRLGHRTELVKSHRYKRTIRGKSAYYCYLLTQHKVTKCMDTEVTLTFYPHALWFPTACMCFQCASFTWYFTGACFFGSMVGVSLSGISHNPIQSSLEGSDTPSHTTVTHLSESLRIVVFTCSLIPSSKKQPTNKFLTS